MLDDLVESRASAVRWRHASVWTAVSLLAHSVVVGGWLVVIATTEPHVPAEQPVTWMSIVDDITLPPLAAPEPASASRPADEPRPAAQPTPTPQLEPDADAVVPRFLPEPTEERSATAVAGFKELAVPLETRGIPPEAMHVDSVRAEDFGGRGYAGGIAGGRVPVGRVAERAGELTAAPRGVQALDLADVTEPPSLRDRGNLARLLERHYPLYLRQERITGTARVRFVVDSSGHVLPASITILAATHPLFEDATRAAVEEFRFTPGRARWEGAMVPVPVYVTLTLEWALR